MASRTWRPALFAATLSLVALTASPAAAAGSSQDAERGDRPAKAGATATFEGETLNLAESWGDAVACMVWPEATGTVECFASEAEMDARVAALEAALGAPSTMSTGAAALTASVAAAGTNCSNYLRLYDGTSYTGATLYIRSRFQWHNLANYGFNQKTSSYKIGACSAYFADYSNGGGAWYPTYLTQAWDVSSSMISGWNNDVSSVLIT